MSVESSEGLSVDIGVDVDLLKSEIKKTSASVSQEPEKDFIFPTGRAWADDLGYPEELAQVPDLVDALEVRRHPPKGARVGAQGATVKAYKPH